MKSLNLKSCLSFVLLLTILACGKTPEKSAAPSAEALKKSGELETGLEKSTLKLTELGCQFEEVPVVSKNTTRKFDYRLVCSPALTNVSGATDPILQLRIRHDVLNEYKMMADLLIKNTNIKKPVRTEAALKAYAVQTQLDEIKSIIDSLSDSESAEKSSERIEDFESQLKVLGCTYQDDTNENYDCGSLALIEMLIRFERLNELVRALNIGLANSQVKPEVKTDWHKRREAVTEEYSNELLSLRNQLRSTPLGEIRKRVEESLSKDTVMKAIGYVDMEIKLHLLMRPAEEDAD